MASSACSDNIKRSTSFSVDSSPFKKFGGVSFVWGLGALKDWTQILGEISEVSNLSFRLYPDFESDSEKSGFLISGIYIHCGASCFAFTKRMFLGGFAGAEAGQSLSR